MKAHPMLRRLILSVGLLAAISASAQTQVVGRSIYQAAPPSLSDGQTTILQADANGNLKVNVAVGGNALPGNVVSGQQAASASAAALPGQALVNGISVIALPTNTGTIYIGGAGVTTGTGYPLAPGQAAGFLVSNLNALYIIGAGGSVGSVAWVGNRDEAIFIAGCTGAAIDCGARRDAVCAAGRAGRHLGRRL